MDGEVYLVSIGKVKMACKIMHVIDQTSHEKNDNEVGIATFLSGIVREGKSKYFPIVYGSSTCYDTIFSDNSKFKEESSRYVVIEYILSKIDKRSDKKRFFRKVRNETDLSVIKGMASEKGIQVPDDIPSTSYVMFSELAWGDIGDFFIKYGKKINLKFWDTLILRMLYAIRDLHRLNIFHGDLHIHNFLIMFHKQDDLIEFIPLIHDFGKSKRVNKWSLNERRRDFEQMMSGMVERSDYYNVPNTVRNKLLEMKSVIDSHTTNEPLYQLLIDFWKINTLH